jgi:hypothetical protein
MGSSVESAEVLALSAAPIDLDCRVVYLPVRHHSPACAWHADRLMRQLRPDAVLIEGPRNANALLPLLTHPATRTPVALYLTYIDRTEEPASRHAAWYPMCDYSPELAAIRAAAAVGCRAQFIDLSLPEVAAATGQRPDPTPPSLLREPFFAHGAFIRAACERTGARDGDDLWDHLFELDYREKAAEDFFGGVLAYCRMVRMSTAESEIAQDGSLERERAMAAAVAEERGRVLVLTGGFHSVALPATAPADTPPLEVAPEDAQVTLMRYGFEQLDRLNGYSSGMPGPEFYQRDWEQRPALELVVEIAGQCRERLKSVSTADAIAAWEHVLRLAKLRGHRRPSREDLLDGVRSVFVKGAADAEGVPVLAIARKALAGNRIGQTPPEAGLPPIVHDFRRTAALLRIRLDRPEASTLTLDLYREEKHRAASRFFHRLRFLDVPFAQCQRGPDFVGARDLERIQEVWQYRWTPDTESALIQLGLYGSTIEEAAAARLVERFEETASQAGSGRSDAAVALVMSACVMGLHRRSAELLARTAPVIAQDPSFQSVARAMERLIVLQHAREPLEAHHLKGIDDLALAAYYRACFLIPELRHTPEEEEKATLEALNTLRQAVETLGDTPLLADLRAGRLFEVADAQDASSSALQGGAAGLLYLDGRLPGDDLGARLGGQLQGDPERGARFLYGLLRMARSVLWAVPECLRSLHQSTGSLPEERFIKVVPHLRLALADLAPRECDRVAQGVAELLGISGLRAPVMRQVSERDALRAFAVDRQVEKSLRSDGLDDWLA